MSYTSPVGLPTFAHPLILHPAGGVENDNVSVSRLLSYPEINLRWDGFTVSHLHWVGVKTANQHKGRIKLAVRHEFWHHSISHTPFALLIKNYMFGLYRQIQIRVLTEGWSHEYIEVPLKPDGLGDKFQKQLEHLIRLQKASALIEEVFAVRSSLVESQEIFKNADDWWFTVRAYLDGYEEFIDGYKGAYYLFDFIANKIGEPAAAGLIHTVLETCDAAKAFVDIMFYMCEFVPALRMASWKLSQKETKQIVGASPYDAQTFFHDIIDVLDPDDSCFRREEMIEFTKAIKWTWGVQARDAENDFRKFLLDPSPADVLISTYNESTHHFFDEGIQEHRYEDGNFILLLEAIRQQLYQGMGLLCPFWEDSSNTCCGIENKAFLEHVWNHTKPDCSKCMLWERLGCLKQKKL
jgi:hypothetical protein